MSERGRESATPEARTVIAATAEDRTVMGKDEQAARAAQPTMAMRPGGAQITPAPPPPAHTPAPNRTPSLDSESGLLSNILPGPGARIKQYEIIREIGAGGMGTVFLARDTKLGRKVAIKFLQTSHPELTQRFILEAKATARCSHENIVIIYEVGEYASSPFMVLEYLHGRTLTALVEDGHKLTPGRAVELMVPVVRALVCAHEEGIVHRDLKPDNVFVTDSGTIKVLDFGIAKVLQGEERSRDFSGSIPIPGDDILSDENTELTRRGAIMGTMSYMSPEQWGIGVEIDHRTDVWAVGIMLYRMLAGRHPLDPLRGQQLVVTAMLDRAMPLLKEHAPSVPPELAAIVDRCLYKHKEMRFESARELLRALEAHLPGRYTREIHIDESPYAGLSSFQEADADRFFGRTREIAAMVTRIRDRPLLAVVGPSGVGKSSFVRAGLVPALKQSGETWETLVIRPGRQPLAALASVLSPLVGTSTTLQDDISEQKALVDRLASEPGYLGTVLRSRARREKRNILLFVDQFEELYTLVPDAAERLAFTACLSGVADDSTAPLRVVLSVRSDFLDRVPEDQRFMSELTQGLFFLTPPDREGLRDAIVQPAEMAGFHFESTQMVEHMLDHLEATPGALPLLQFAATKLWDARDKGRKLLTDASYQAIGGIAGALALHADQVLADLPPGAQALAKQIFMRLVTSELTRAIVSVSELRELSHEKGELQRVLDHLVQARLILVQSGSEAVGGATAEIVHESLVHSWPTLRRWLDENQDDAALLEQLRNAAKQWQAKGHDPGVLWRGEAVAEARRWHRRYKGELPELQQRYLDAVFSLASKSARRRRLAVVGTMVFLVGLVAVSAVALVVIRGAHKEAEKNAEAARSAEVQARESEKLAKDAEVEAKARLAEVQEKERERRREEELKEKAEAQAAAANTQVELTAEELKNKNAELLVALERAERAHVEAQKAQERAEENAEAAKASQRAAERAQGELARLLEEEKKRAKRLEEKLGSQIVDTLK
jgi:eukaryotic-like serine/threonine-protein kinase